MTLRLPDNWTPPRAETPDELIDRLARETVALDARRADGDGDFLTRSLVDWATARDLAAGAEFLVEPLIATGRAHVLYAGVKSGKSLLSLWLCAQVALGRAALDRPAGDPLRVLYLDAENSLDDILERLDGFGVDPADLARTGTFAYALLPQLTRGIDSHVDAEVIVRHALDHHADLVVVDTTSAFVAGDENSADTWAEVGRLLTRPLKAAGIATWRVDHAGRDVAKGPRGSSAKVADADVVWSLDPGESGGFRLYRRHARMPWVPERVDLHRVEAAGVTTWRRVGFEWPAGTKDTAALLDELGVALDASARSASDALREAGEGRRRTVVLAALKYRREVRDEG